MNIFSAKACASTTPPPPTFIGLVFALIGWGLLEIGLLSQHVRIQAHLIPAAIFLYLASSSLRRLKPSQRIPIDKDGYSAPQRRGSPALQTGCALFLLMAGALAGAVILAGSIGLLGLALVALTYAPWSRLALCRERIVIASITMCAGTGLTLLFNHHAINTVFFLIAGWLFWLCAICAVLGRIAKLWSVERAIKATVRSASKQIA